MHIRKTQMLKHTKYFSASEFSRGFTLIELLIVLALMLILAALTFQGFAQYSYRQVYVGFVSEVRDNIAESRQKTIASYEDTTYGVYVGTSTIEFFPGSVPLVGSVDNIIVAIPNGMTATSSFSNAQWYLSFARITGGASAIGTIMFNDTRTNASTTFTIYASGLVE
jgi:prepilin-type N-terminal cleavage/methylation domain-containing protein